MYKSYFISFWRRYFLQLISSLRTYQITFTRYLNHAFLLKMNINFSCIWLSNNFQHIHVGYTKNRSIIFRSGIQRTHEIDQFRLYFLWSHKKDIFLPKNFLKWIHTFIEFCCCQICTKCWRGKLKSFFLSFYRYATIIQTLLHNISL